MYLKAEEALVRFQIFDIAFAARWRLLDKSLLYSPCRLVVMRDQTCRHTVPVGTRRHEAHRLLFHKVCVSSHSWFWSLYRRARMLCSISKLRVFVTMAHHIDHRAELTDAEVSLNHDTLGPDVKGISSTMPPIDNRLPLHTPWHISYTIRCSIPSSMHSYNSCHIPWSRYKTQTLENWYANSMAAKRLWSEAGHVPHVTGLKQGLAKECFLF